ncbi:TonB-dependent vitamin B12 receptor [Methylosoma difficile]
MQKIIVSSLLITGFSTTLQAETSEVTTLPEKVVTATRSDFKNEELAAASTVYTREDIERSQARTLPDLFKGSLGVDLAQSGGYGQTTDVFLRGTNPGHVLVLIDGIKVGSATSGTTAYELLPIDQIERVEIIRGPQSSLYGSEAIGGVIQIFTRKGKEGKTKVALQAGGGSYDTAQTAGSVSGKIDNSWYNLGVSHINSQGFSVKQNSDPDRDGYENTGLNARIGHHFDNNAELEASFMRAEGIKQYDSSYGGDNAAFANHVISLSGSMDMTDNLRSTVRLGQSQDQLQTFLSDSTNDGHFYTTRWNASWLNQLHINDDQQMVLGSDYRLDEVESDDLDSFSAGFNSYQERSRYDVGVFTELHSRLFDRHFLNTSLRWDKNQAFGDYVTGNIGWRFNSETGISPFASFGNAFKAPNFNELYWPDDGFGGHGNPNLKPEESRSFEVGLAGKHRLASWELRAYHTDADQLIAGWPPVNVNKARIEGIEAEISTNWLGWHHKLAMSILEPIDTSTGLRLQRRTDKTLSFDMSRSLNAFDVGANVLAQGDRPDLAYDAAFNPVRVNLHGFVTVDLRTAYHIDKNWMVSAKLNNLFNEIYQTANTYITADRNFFISIHYNN